MTVLAHHAGEDIVAMALASGGAGAAPALALLARARLARAVRWLRRR